MPKQFWKRSTFWTFVPLGILIVIAFCLMPTKVAGDMLIGFIALSVVGLGVLAIIIRLSLGIWFFSPRAISGQQKIRRTRFFFLLNPVFWFFLLLGIVLVIEIYLVPPMILLTVAGVGLGIGLVFMGALCVFIRVARGFWLPKVLFEEFRKR